LKDQDQTLTVEKVKKPVTPPSSTTPSSSKPTTPSTTPTPTPKVSLPTTGSETGDVIAYGGAVAMLVALGSDALYTLYEKEKINWRRIRGSRLTCLLLSWVKMKNTKYKSRTPPN